MYGIDMVKPYSMGGIFASLQKIQQGEVENLLVSPDEFKDAIVFIGVSAVGGSDLKPTPLAASSPGVIFHVSLAGNYLMKDFLRPPVRRITVVSMVLGAFLTTFVIFFSNRFFIRVAFPLALLSSYVGYALFAFKSNMMVEEVPFIFSTVTSSFLSFGYLAFTERQKSEKCPTFYPVCIERRPA
jgi:adenylate cyclase